MTQRTPEQIIGKDRLLQLIFEGYVVVPAKPTEAMLDAAAREKDRVNNEFPSGESGPAIDPQGDDYWRVMISAANGERTIQEKP